MFACDQIKFTDPIETAARICVVYESAVIDSDITLNDDLINRDRSIFLNTNKRRANAGILHK